jgi:TonB family protein
MWSSDWYSSDHARLKLNYARYMLCAAFAALVVTGLGFVLSPPYIPAPTTLREEAIPGCLIIEPQYFIKEPPKAITFEEPFCLDWEIDPFATVETTISLMENPFKDIPQRHRVKAVPQYQPIPDEMPVIVFNAPLEYPPFAVEAEAVGEIVIIVLVGVDGRVVSAHIQSSTASDILEAAALEAARKCLFEPARQRNRPVECQVSIPYSFTLD